MQQGSDAMDFTVEIDVDEDTFTEELKKAIDPDKYRSLDLVIGAPHSRYVEFGSTYGNAHPTPKKTYRLIDGSYKELTEFQYRLYCWCVDAFGNKDPYRMMRLLYKRIIERGIRPSYFVTKAIDDIEADIPDMIARGDGTMEIAEALKERIEHHLYDTSPPRVSRTDPFEDSIIDSIRIEESLEESNE